MKTQTLNKYQMVISVQNYLDTNNATWSTIAIMNTFKSGLDELILRTREEMKATGSSTKGITINKNDLKQQLAIKTAVLSGALSAYASVTGNTDLLNNGSFVKTDVMQLRDVEIPETLSHFAELITPHLPLLVDYGVSKAQLRDLTSSIDDFRELIGKPRLQQSEANLAKQASEDLVEQAMDLLNAKMDKVMLQFQLTQPAFYEGYKKARVIID